MSHQLRYDYVIVGAGLAGCVLAHRLSADPDVTVALVEAGPDATADPRVTQPSRWPQLMGSELDWSYLTVPQRHLNGRRLSWPRGRLVGGSSAMHAMVYVEGHASDYDAWAVHGGTEWGSRGMLPWLARVAGTAGDRALLSVESPSRPHPFAEAFVSAGEEIGLAVNPDFNSGQQEGIGLYRVMRRAGRRCGSADAYLAPAVSRANLTVLAGTRVMRLLLDKTTATGVQVRRAGRLVTLRAEREVVLSAGAVATPHLLMLSGIGPADHLRAHGIAVACDVPGVGGNLHDHVQVSVSFPTDRTLPVTDSSNLGEAGGFVSSTPGLPAPDIQLSFAPMIDLNDASGFGRGFTIGPAVTRPVSRGRLTLRSADPWQPPAIDPDYLSQQADVDTLVEGVRLAHRLADTRSLRRFRDLTQDRRAPADLVDFCRSNAQTQFHPVGSCRLGTDTDAVVDSDLLVRGCEGLRVVDASVMPAVTTGNISAPVFAIAEKAAAKIVGRDSAPLPADVPPVPA
ncbi:GMC family oxidoreductase N-terminal domain-containing protein [Streptomyces sp. NPDC049906]|uniref:GMC family oxidoreductase n=1 Tax=Streptomyces sp. NPDC049906 TaxID=3155656 RepID=UPI0034485F58